MSIGTDQWVAQADARIEGPGGWWGRGKRRWGSLPPLGRLAAIVAVAALVPLVVSSDFLVRIGVSGLLLALLAVGLNVSVGWAGLLDLGYVAFYGFGAYTFALLSSDQLGVHLPTLLAVPIAILLTGLLGVVLGLSSWRLSGDYLAIVTLFFSQIFLELTLNVDRLGVDLTGGPNGISGVNPFHILGFEFSTPTEYFYLLLVIVAVIVTILYLIDGSRTGRAWRALRDDELAAEIMTVPTRGLKLMAFATGAAVAGLAGSVFASFQLGVYPLNFQVQFLIVIYAALILGGSGSLAGAVAGGIVVTLVLDLLRDPAQASAAFYGVIAITLIAKVRPWRVLALVVGSTVALGFAVHAVVGAISADAVSGQVGSNGVFGSVIESWVVLPEDPTKLGNWAFCVLVLGVIALTRVSDRARTILLVPLLYLAAFVWENRLVEEPSITRQLLLGVLLIVMMISRPHGLLGTPRVERV